MVCDQLVRCMENHNRNVFAKRIDPRNEMTMRACVEFILKNGHVPVVTVQNMGTMKQYEYSVNEANVLSEKWAKMPYSKLSFVMKNSDDVQEYSTISMPKHTMGYHASW